MISKIREMLWHFASSIRIRVLRTVYGMNIDLSSTISYAAKLDKSVNPKGVYIGAYSYVLYGAIVLTHDHSRNLKTNTVIGRNCIIGINAIIMPGVIVNDYSVVGSGAIVTKDVPSYCIVAGNPAVIIKENISVGNDGIIKSMCNDL